MDAVVWEDEPDDAAGELAAARPGCCPHDGAVPKSEMAPSATETAIRPRFNEFPPDTVVPVG